MQRAATIAEVGCFKTAETKLCIIITLGCVCQTVKEPTKHHGFYVNVLTRNFAHCICRCTCIKRTHTVYMYVYNVYSCCCRANLDLRRFLPSPFLPSSIPVVHQSAHMKRVKSSLQNRDHYWRNTPRVPVCLAYVLMHRGALKPMRMVPACHPPHNPPTPHTHTAFAGRLARVTRHPR